MPIWSRSYRRIGTGWPVPDRREKDMSEEMVITAGELFRLQTALSRDVDKLQGEMQATRREIQRTREQMVGLPIRLDTAEEKLKTLEKRVDSVVQRSALISGGIAVIAWFGEVFGAPWRHA